ncbi:MAG: heavy metal translocating P-type ATPase [Planctomycetota bacterium]
MTTVAAPPNIGTADAVECSHCGLDVPAGLIESDATEQFCCQGCRSVYRIIHGSGLDRYYDMRRSLERKKARAESRETPVSVYEDPAFIARYTETVGGITTATLALEGLHCPACVWLIERLGRVVPGVLEANVNASRMTVRVRWQAEHCTFADVVRGLHELGYPAAPPRDDAESRRPESRSHLVRIGVAGALAGNVMLVSIALYAGVFEGIEAKYFALFRWVSAVLGLIALAWPGRIFFRGAIAAVRTRTPHLDIPISLALLVGTAWGLSNTIRGTGEIYFDTLTTLIFLLLIGRFIQAQQQRRAADAVDMLLRITPGIVRLVQADGLTQSRPVEAANVDDVAEVHAGETIPIDGCVVEGESDQDEAILTGESVPVPAREGDNVWAGAVNLTSTIRVRVTAVGAATRSARLMQLVSDAAASKSPIVQLADRISGWFVVIATSIAIIIGAAWTIAGSPHAIDHATAMLIVTCPCALGMATPLVLSVGIGRLARAGILVKGGEPIERLSKPGTIFLDKTGTLTTGSMRVVEWYRVDDETACRVRSLEAKSRHPIARAIAASGSHAAEADGAQHITGAGAIGEVEGKSLVVGTPRLLSDEGIAIDQDTEAWAAEVGRRGLSAVLVAEDGRLAGGVAIGDEVRPEARHLVDNLCDSGWTVAVLSGDAAGPVAHAAAELGIDNARSRMSPEQKLAAVRHAVRARDDDGSRGAIVMIGDGVNDSAALAAADVGIAVHGGADVSLDAADVSMQRAGLGAIAQLLLGSRNAMDRIRLCIGASLGYNFVAVTLAAAGILHPLLAAVLMPISSITVVSIAAGTGARLGETTAGGE